MKFYFFLRKRVIAIFPAIKICDHLIVPFFFLYAEILMISDFKRMNVLCVMDHNLFYHCSGFTFSPPTPPLPPPPGK